MFRQVGALLLALSIATSVRAASPVDALVDSGSKRLEAGDFEGALAEFKKAAAQAPKDPRPHYLRAVALERRGDKKSAEVAFRDALRLDPKLAEVRGELGALLSEEQRYPEAIFELDEAVKERPDLVEAYYNLGLAHAALRHCKEAAAAYRRVTELRPKEADGYINLSVAERQCKRPVEAVKAGRQAAKVAPDSAPAHLNLGLAFTASGKRDEAIAEYRIATRIKPDYGTAWWSLGLAELDAGRPKEALAPLEKALQLQPSAARAADLGRALRNSGALERAVALFDEAIRIDPKYAPAHFYRAETVGALGRCAEVHKEIEALGRLGRAEAAKDLKDACKKK